ncbi:hypothetical protein SFC79_19945 [Nocardioides sp. S-58]|uniref:HTH luxR-type domain-containing protein n=1 Tax=Nocardioides renjunii TaxID=3095075 RepID=A0ABU5KHW4_9ACTN|nr:hypothetical protein [Nocardioides sp. S-58]
MMAITVDTVFETLQVRRTGHFTPPFHSVLTLPAPVPSTQDMQIRDDVHLIVSPRPGAGADGAGAPTDEPNAAGVPPRWNSRDVAIVELLARSTPRTEVAARLGCSPSTVDRRLGVLRDSLGVHTTIEVIVEAVRRGVI